MSKTYNLFMSHSWTCSTNYKELVSLLDAAPDFHYRDFSVPKGDPVHSTSNPLLFRQAIRNKMGGCHAIVILAGVDSQYSKWINEEIKLANKGFDKPKPIVAVQFWGPERTSELVKDNADIIVEWDTSSIVRGIRQVTR